MQLILIGSYPDYGGAIGGISMHIKRLRMHLLLNGDAPIVYTPVGEGNADEGIFTVRGSIDIAQKLWRHQGSLVHIHVTGWKTWALVGMVNTVRRGKTILTVHGEGLSRTWDSAGRLKRMALARTLRSYDHVVAVNDHVADSVRRAVPGIENLSMIPAFVPPIPQQADRDNVPNNVWRFVDSHGPLVSINGWMTWLNGIDDLYGFDLMLQALRVLLKTYPNLGVVAAVCGVAPGASDLWERTRLMAGELGVADNVCWVTEPCEYYPILERSDVMIRPTRTDGWPLSIGEAMWFDVPVVASDACQRPAGAITFRSGDAEDLACKIATTLDGAPRPGLSVPAYHEELMSLYERLSAS